MKISKMRLMATAAPFAAMLVITPAYAQDESAETAGDGGIEEIIVTAQRREENLQDVPISVSAFGAEQIAEKGINDVSRLEGLVPGFTFGKSGVDARPAIRGVRTESVDVNADTTIGMFIDGIYHAPRKRLWVSSIWSVLKCSVGRKARFMDAIPLAVTFRS
jgi:iron complex outermembrane recepter protein